MDNKSSLQVKLNKTVPAEPAETNREPTKTFAIRKGSDGVKTAVVVDPAGRRLVGL
jgi:hypothetical protein